MSLHHLSLLSIFLDVCFTREKILLALPFLTLSPWGHAFLVPATKIFPNPGSSQTYTHIFLCYSHWLVPSVWPNAWTAFLANL